MRDNWRPNADVEVLQKRARMLQDIRAFFLLRQVMAVETPLLTSAGITDPSIESVCAEIDSQQYFLQTSPEYPMKRLLCAGSGDIYQIAKVFRGAECGRYHNPEFTLLEWYRLGFTDEMLANEVIELIEIVAGRSFVVESVAYAALFRQRWDLDIFSASTDTLEELSRHAGVHPGTAMTCDSWLDLLLSMTITPEFPQDRLTIVRDYPASQASLARKHSNGLTAGRFEIYWGGVELANGYHELADAAEQRQRFEADNQQRKENDQLSMPLDERFLQALEGGLPDCSGVALGLDRLLMCVAGADQLQDVLAFPIDSV